MNRPVRLSLVGLYIVALVYLTSAFVGAMANRDLLVEASAVLPLFPVLGLHYLRPNERFAGWAVFTLWLGSTYAMSGETSEVLVFCLIAGAALLGYLRYPWLMPAAWFFHIGWDFVPRELPELLHDLPLACMIFDGLIGLYLVWLVRSGRARSAGQTA